MYRKAEQFPKAVLCHTYTELFIQNRKERLCVTNLDSFDGVTDLVERYRETLKHFSTVAIYGVYRLSAMKKTHMLATSIASDIAFIQELSIYGNFVQVPQILFSYIVEKNGILFMRIIKTFRERIESLGGTFRS